MNINKRFLRQRLKQKHSYSKDDKHPKRNNSYSLCLETNQCESNDQIPIEIDDSEQKIKEEAKLLIEKTKKMMKDLSLDKSPIDSKGINSPLSTNRILHISQSKTSIDTLTQKLIVKNKQIKLLEKELKEKTNQLKITQDKLQLKNTEIQKLNESLTIERSNNLKVENMKLQRKVIAIEKANEENKKMYEKLIEDYKDKINGLNFIKKENEDKIREIERSNTIMNKEICDMKEELESKVNENMELEEEINNERKIKEKMKIEMDDLKLNFSNVIVLLKTLYSKENTCKQKSDEFLTKFKSVFTKQLNDFGNSMMKSTNSSDYEQQRRAMNNIDYQEILKNKK